MCSNKSLVGLRHSFGKTNQIILVALQSFPDLSIVSSLVPNDQFIDVVDKTIFYEMVTSGL